MKKLELAQIIDSNAKDRVISKLNQFTNARIAIGHSGGHIKTKNWLEFQLDFAQAKDAVMKSLDLAQLATDMTNSLDIECQPICATSKVNSLDEFLTRPDLGRQLSVESFNELTKLTQSNPQLTNQDILIVVSGGLSSAAIENQAVGFLSQFLPLVAKFKLKIAPIILAQHSRVAFADKVNEIFKAKVLVNLIGERPGLSSNDSMSIYFTYDSRINSTDEQRNCISNIHRNGLSYQDSSQKLMYLINKACQCGYSGVNLKDDFSLEAFQKAIMELT